MSKSPLHCSNEEGFSHILLLIAVLVATGLIASANITTTQQFPTSTSQYVLGEDTDKNNEQAQETAKKISEQQQETQQKQQEQQKESNQKSETETETLSGQKIKTKVEDNGATKIEIEQDKLKLKYESENGQVKIDAENKNGKKVELKDDGMEKAQEDIDNKLENEGIKISTESGKPVITKNNIKAEIDFPLSVDIATRQLTVTTPNGQKAVTVLPDQAIQTLLSANIINKIQGQIANASPSAKLGNINGTIKLEVKDQTVVYKVNGEKEYKVLGFIPISTPVTAFVSAESGNLVTQEQSLLANLIKLISF
ncbi:hypothetical protein M1437_04005 [Patescibacteria group bacterium]|nr:hypothetical protein [Patescibacteria group bacterium]MCL5784999.1 hypothetical protein [Patescibacteria group bacterium]